MIEASGVVGELEAQSLVEGCPSFPLAHAERHVVSSGSEEGRHETSSCWAETSLTVAGAAHAEHTEKRPPVKALTGTESAAGSTWTVAGAAAAVGRICSGAGHVGLVTLLMLENSIEACDMTLGGRGVSAFELRPSFRRYLNNQCQLVDDFHNKFATRTVEEGETYRRTYSRSLRLECCKGLGGCSS